MTVEKSALSAAPPSPPKPPTEDPSLPPAIVETPGPGFAPTATARPRAPISGGLGTGSGVVISDIFYNGTKGSAVISTAAHTPAKCRIYKGHNINKEELAWAFPSPAT